MIRTDILRNAAAALVLAATAFSATAPAMAQSGPVGAGYGSATTVVQPLTPEELQWMQFMREEEKLARDVYQALFEKWNLVVFQNIAASEGTHFAAIGTLLTRYGATDPAQSSAGVYTDPTLNTLYNQLLEKGMRSAADALEVGVLIEKQDIADLETALKATAKFDVKRVYNNLMNGSYNHLDVFETVCALTTPTN
jgi:hypothetical protein